MQRALHLSHEILVRILVPAGDGIVVLLVLHPAGNLDEIAFELLEIASFVDQPHRGAHLVVDALDQAVMHLGDELAVVVKSSRHGFLPQELIHAHRAHQLLQFLQHGERRHALPFRALGRVHEQQGHLAR